MRDASDSSAAVGRSDEAATHAPLLGFSPPLDGLRAVAVLMVLLVHAAYEVFGSFAAGVDLFFVVSGFLIVTLLLEEHGATGGIDVRQFYVRRVLRLFPALYTTILGTLAALLVVGDEDIRRQALDDAWAAGLYVYHVVHPVHQELVGGGAPEIRPLVHLWSLSVEEHFYLVVAVGMVAVLRRRWLGSLAAAFVGLWLFVGIARLSGHVGPRFAWYQRPDSLLIGVVGAIANARWLPAELRDHERTVLRRAGLAAAGAFTLLVWTGTKFAKPLGAFVTFIPPRGRDLTSGTYWGEFGFSLASVLAVVVVVSVVRVADAPLARVLSWRPLVAIGRRSYVIYLLHVPVFLVVLEAAGEGSPWLLASLPLFVMLVELVHRHVEGPAMRLRHRFQRVGASGV